MKFLDKYELIEQLTSGAVGTFMARDLASGERVLVHIFSGFDRKADQTPLQWALQSFRSLAPPPLGDVIDGGGYLQAPGAFLITKFPNPNNLPGWVRLYNSQSEKTQEFHAPIQGASTREVKSAHVSPPVAPLEPSGGTKSQFSRVFRGVAAKQGAPEPVSPGSGPETVSPKPGPEPAAATQSAPSPWSRRVAGPFTKEFLAALDEERGGKPIPGTSSLPQEVPPASSFTAQFLMPRADIEAARPAPKEAGLLGTNPFGSDAPQLGKMALGVPAVVPGEEGSPRAPATEEKQGEFTQYFVGPFQGAPAAVTPNLPQRTYARPDESSEFRKVFGTGASQKLGKPQESPPREAGRPPAAENEVNSPPGRNFDHLFDTLTEKRVEEPGVKAEETAWPSAGKAPVRRPEPAIWTGLSPIGLSPLDRPEMDASLEATSPAGATRVFTPRSASPAPLPAPEGPSDFTRIISPPRAPNPPAPGPQGGSGSPAGSAPVMMSFPPLPPAPPLHVPAVPPPDPFHPPNAQLPNLKAPPAPTLTPLPPASPKLPQVPPAQVSYWPLILALNVLLIAAVALILYFALKK